MTILTDLTTSEVRELIEIETTYTRDLAELEMRHQEAKARIIADYQMQMHKMREKVERRKAIDAVDAREKGGE